MNQGQRLSPAATDTSGGQSPGPVRQQRLGAFDWLIAEQFEPRVRLDLLENPQRLLAAPSQPLKRVVVPGREVVCRPAADAAAGGVVVKHFTPRGPLEAIKWSWRASPARRAFELARQIQALGLLTATPLAAGERRCCGWLRESYLLTTHLAAATPLYQVNAHCADRSRRVRLVRKLAQLYATMHDAGFHHHDPSQTNFLVLPQAGGQEALALIDLDGLRRWRRNDLAEAARDLRRLLLRCRVSRRERAWFVAAYARARKPRLNPRTLLTEIGPLPAQASLPFCALDEDGQPNAAGSTPVPPGSPGTQLRHRSGLRWRVRPAWLTLQAEVILSAPDRFLEQARVLKPSRSSAVSAQEGLVLKRYNFRKWGNLFLDLFRGSRARRAFRKACRLEACGISTARAVATADERFLFLPRRSYFLMEEIRDAAPLHAWGGDRGAACKRVAELLAQMHAQGFTHRDLKDGNIVFDRAGRPYLIDLDGLQFVKRVSDAQALADLVRLARDLQDRHRRLARAEGVRFLVAYCRARKLPDWRWWWREIERRVAPTSAR